MLKTLSSNRQKVKKFIENKSFDLFIMLLICLNAVVFGLLTPETATDTFGGALFVLDRLCMAIFIVEMALKLYVYGTKFFTTHWNTFDLLVILVSAFSISSYFIVLRTFRLFRLLKYIDRFSKLKQILRIFNALLPNFMAVLMVFGVFLYVFAIMAVSLFGDVFIEFSTLGNSVFSLLQVFTLDGWSSTLARPVMSIFPHAWIFFLAFLLVSFLISVSFIMSVIDEIVRRDLIGRHREEKAEASALKSAKKISPKSSKKKAVVRKHRTTKVRAVK